MTQHPHIKRASILKDTSVTYSDGREHGLSKSAGSLPSADGVKMPDAVTKKLQKLIDDQEPMPADIAEIINEDLFDLI